MTPHELRLAIEAHNDKLQYEREQMVTHAYYTAAWQRAKKMPRLNDVLHKMRPPTQKEQQTPEQMLAIAKVYQKRLTER